MNPAIETMPRHMRRQLLDAEARRRKSGDWPAWEHVPTPGGIPPFTSWLREIRVAHRNSVFAVLERPLPDGATHLMVSSLSNLRPSWWEMQRIKDEIAGPDRTAIEIYPPHDEIVDQADAYHIWVLPAGLPYSIFERAAP